MCFFIYFLSSRFLCGNLGRATGDRFRASTKVRDGYDILKRTDGRPCIRRIILSESYSSRRSASRCKCILFLWGSEDSVRFLHASVDCYWMLACTKVSEKQRARTGEHSPYSLLLCLMDRKLQTGSAMFRLCPLQTKRPGDNSSLETRNQNTSFKCVGR